MLKLTSILYTMLIISTTPHFYSILPLIKYYKQVYGYITIIIVSTIFSILYHLYEESNNIITLIDYLCAGTWVLYDIYMAYTDKQILVKVLLANAGVFVINICIPYNLYYQLNHSLWHCINAYKCFYVSNLISIGLKK